LTEKEMYLKGLEAEKKEAERYRSIKNELLASQATEVRLKLDSANNRKAKILTDLKKVEEDLENIAKEIEDKEKTKISLKKKINSLEDEIEKKGGEEQLALQKSLENMKVDLESQKNLITSSENEIQRVKNRRYQLEKNLKELNAKIAEKTGEKSEFVKKKNELDKKIESSRKKAGLDGKSLEELQEALEKAERSIEEFKQEKDNGAKRLQQITSDQQILEYKLQDLESKISDIEAKSDKLAKIKDEKDKYKDILKEIGLLANKDSKLAFRLGELRKELIGKEEELARQRICAGSNQELLLRDRAIKVILDMKKSKKAKGILGTVAELGKVNPKYATSLQVAAGGRMKNIVVDTPEVAIACLKALKESKSGTATFLPLSKIKIPILKDSVKSLANLKGVHGFAHELITSDSKYAGLWEEVWGEPIAYDSEEEIESNYDKIGI